MSVASSEIADTDVNQIANSPAAVIVGEATDAFVKIANLLESYSVRVAHLPEKHLLYKLAELQASREAPQISAMAGQRRGGPSPDLYLLNLVTPFRYDWRDMVRRLKVAQPNAGIVLVFDQPTSETSRQAMQAGADEILYEPELSVAALVWRRIGHLIGLGEQSGEAQPREAASGMREAEPAVERASSTTTDVVERHVLGIAVPHLRAASGRLDATRIARRLGVPIARLATVVGVSRQALSQTPDSPGIQAALHPIARMFDVLDRVLDADDQRKWLHATHAHLEGRTPLETLMNGQAEIVARLLESI